MTNDADLLIYGCSVASTEISQAWLSDLSELLQVDLAASSDLTGNANLGGDWDFEYNIGSIESMLLIQSDWWGLLNAAPTVNADTVNTSSGTPVNFNVLSNDSDSDGGTLSIVEYSNPTDGSLSYSGSGAFTYTPGTFGANTFQYRVDDGQYALGHYYGLAGNGVDAIGGNNATAITGTTTVAGRFGNALSFDEVDDRVTIPDFGYTSSFTLSFDFRIDDNTGTTFQYIYSHGTVSLANSINIYVGEASHASLAGVLLTNIADSNDATYASELDVNIASLIGDGNWHNYTLTVDPTNGARVYIDGVLSASNATRMTNSFDPSGSMFLGGRNDADAQRFYGGMLDSVRIYDRLLTATEVANQASPTTLVGTVSLNLTNVVTVTNTNDTVNGTTSSISALNASNGGDGISLREAITAANSTSGIDTINFNIAGTEHIPSR